MVLKCYCYIATLNLCLYNAVAENSGYCADQNWDGGANFCVMISMTEYCLHLPESRVGSWLKITLIGSFSQVLHGNAGQES